MRLRAQKSASSASQHLPHIMSLKPNFWGINFREIAWRRAQDRWKEQLRREGEKFAQLKTSKYVWGKFDSFRFFDEAELTGVAAGDKCRCSK